MDRRRRHSPWLAALFALLIGMFALSSVTDAAACGAEIEPAHVSEAFEQADTHKNMSDAAHGVCSHGHCHHGVKASSDRVDEGADHSGRAIHVLSPDDMRTAHAPEGLKRPPRG